METNKELIKSDNDLLKKATERDKNQIDILISKIKIVENPRTQFDDKSLKELAESISKNGQLQPILIDKDNNLIAGERRIRAIKLLGKNKISAVVYKGTAKNSKILAVLENIQREDLSTLDLGNACLKLKDEHGWNQNEIAKHLHKSKQWVSELILNYKKSVAPDSPESSKDLSSKKIRNLRANGFDENQLNFNFRWKLSKKLKAKLTKQQIFKLEKKVVQMEKLKTEIGEIINKTK